MNKLLDEYREKFKEQFPLMLVMGIPEDEISEIIKVCINSGQPYDPELKKDSVY